MAKRIAEASEPHDAADWRFVRTLSPSSSSGIAHETKLLFGRLRKFRSEIADLLKESQGPDFRDINLYEFFDER